MIVDLVAELRFREFLIPPALESQVIWEELLSDEVLDAVSVESEEA